MIEVPAGPSFTDEVMVEVERIKGEFFQMAAEKAAIREELVQVFQSFKDFGNTHCREVGQRRTDFTDLYLKLKALVERV